MINGVLVERTVKDVVPALKTNSEGLKKVLEDLVKQYNSKQLEMEKWKVGPTFWIASRHMRQAADRRYYRKRTTSRLFSSKWCASQVEFWGGRANWQNSKWHSHRCKV